MTPGLILMVGLVIVAALAAMRVDMGPAKECEWHTWEYNDDAKRYECTTCGMGATDE